MLEAVTGSSADYPDARMVGMRCADQTSIRSDLVPAGSCSNEGRFCQRRKTTTKVGAHVRFSSRRRWKVGIGIERRPLVVDRSLDARLIDIGGPIPRALVITPGGNAWRSPCRSAIEEQQLLLSDLQ